MRHANDDYLLNVLDVEQVNSQPTQTEHTTAHAADYMGNSETDGNVSTLGKPANSDSPFTQARRQSLPGGVHVRRKACTISASHPRILPSPFIAIQIQPSVDKQGDMRYVHMGIDMGVSKNSWKSSRRKIDATRASSARLPHLPDGNKKSHDSYEFVVQPNSPLHDGHTFDNENGP